MNLRRSAAASVFFVGFSALAEVQSQRNIADLTVPASQLPAGCGLKPVDPKPVVTPGGGPVTFSGQPSMPANPWTGTDRGLVVDIRKRIDGEPPPVPDATALDRRAAAAYNLKWAEDVAEAYRATYHAGDESLVDVFAVRFNDPALAKPRPPADVKNPPRGLRLVVGPMVVLVSGKDDACFQAVSKHVQSLR